MDDIIRGTTPTLKFTIPYTASQIQKYYVTFKENSHLIIDKSYDDENVSIANNVITVVLTQKETLRFTNSPNNVTVYIQVRLLLKDGTAIASEIYPVSVSQILKEGVI